MVIRVTYLGGSCTSFGAGETLVTVRYGLSKALRYHPGLRRGLGLMNHRIQRAFAHNEPANVVPQGKVAKRLRIWLLIEKAGRGDSKSFLYVASDVNGRALFASDMQCIHSLMWWWWPLKWRLTSHITRY